MTDHVNDHYKQVPGWFDFEALYDRAVARVDGPAVFVEVGSFLGKSACYMAQRIRESGKLIAFFCVDHFLGSVDMKWELRGGTIYINFLKNITEGGFRDLINPMCCPSLEASRHFTDGSLDFIFLDGSHDLNSVRQDILLWQPKLKASGWMAGHDYGDRYPDVRIGVTELLPDHGVLGSSWFYPVSAIPKFESSVAEFAHWYMTERGLGIPRCLEGEGIRTVGGFTGITLFRQGKYQVQMWLCPPGSEIPDHSHPGVDIVQVYLSGQVFLRLNGKPIVTPELCATERLNGKAIRVRDCDTHGATIGSQGGAFLTIEEWANGQPESVELAWEGEPLSDDHARILKGRSV